MPFRAAFDCLWCGAHHTVRSDTDLEGWASLCPECIGRASDNGFLRARLHAALAERVAAAAPEPRAAAVTPEPRPAPDASPTGTAPRVPSPLAPTEISTSSDDWYLRRGRFSAGPIVDQPWLMELEEATRWLDALPFAGTIIELAAGTGWWSTLLADKGELWLFESDEAALEQARKRLVAHGLLAHLHVRDPLADPERSADAVFSAYFLGSAADAQELLARLAVVRGWLRPGGRFAFIDAAPSGSDAAPTGSDVEPVGSDAAPDRSEPRSILGPRGPLVPRSVETLRAALADAGFEQPVVTRTHSAFVLGSATAPA